MKVPFWSLVVIVSTSYFYNTEAACSSKKITCITDTSYQFCFDVNGSEKLVGNVKNCSEGYVCSEDNGSFACMITTEGTTNATTVSVTQSITNSTTEFITETATNSPTESASESTINSTTESATETTTNSATESASESPANATVTESTTNSTTEYVSESTTTNSTTNTTTEAVTAPTCVSEGNYTASACNQYYQCVAVLWNYYPVLKTCPSGQEFIETSTTCEDSTTCTA